MSGDPLSRHPADQLIRELIATGRAATEEEVARIVARLATAPFDPRVLPVPAALRGARLGGRTLGHHEPAVTIHLAQRVIGDGQWSAATTEADYLADLRRGIGDPSARLVIYKRRGGPIAATLTPADRALPSDRRGPKSPPWLYVVYAVDRGIIVSGYGASGPQTLSIPEDARWLR